MACLLYCVTLPGTEVRLASGVGDSEVASRELPGLRVYWSELANPEACLAEAEALKRAAVQFHQVLREILKVVTLLPFRFPTLLENAEELEQHLAPEQEQYLQALGRIGDAVQYEIIASWEAGEPTDLAAPVSGREYLKRRQEAATRTAAVDSKLKSVAGDTVAEWRSRQERKTHRWFALVPRDNRERFLASLRGTTPSQGVRLRLTGPWPPSEFILPRGEHG